MNGFTNKPLIALNQRNKDRHFNILFPKVMFDCLILLYFLYFKNEFLYIKNKKLDNINIYISILN